MKTRNCVAVYVMPALGKAKCGPENVPVPTDGVPEELLTTLAPYLIEQYDSRDLTRCFYTEGFTWEDVVKAAKEEIQFEKEMEKEQKAEDEAWEKECRLMQERRLINRIKRWFNGE